MDPIFSANEYRPTAAVIFFTIAAVLGLAWGAMKGAMRAVSWPLFLGGFMGFALWQFAAIGLLWDGSMQAGLAVAAIGSALLLSACAIFSIDDKPWLVAVGFFLLGLGALVAPGEELGFWLAGAGAACSGVLVAIVFLTGKWWPALAYAVACCTLFMVGGVVASPVGQGVTVLPSNIAHVRAAEPYWLLLLLLIPLLIAWSFRGLATLGPARRAIALGLRCLLVLLLSLALAEVYLLHTNETTTVLFLWDRSLSIPEEFDPNDTRIPPTDLVFKRQLDFINSAVASRGTKHQPDKAGLIVFGRYPRLELPPASVPHFGLKKLSSTIDSSYTDISAAIKLALACFPEGTGKRIVLISDGNENLGRAEEQARLAKQNGIEIDSIVVAAGTRNQSEILVDRIEAPSLAETDSRMPIRIILRSYNPETVVGRLSLTKTSLIMAVDPTDPSGQMKNAYNRFPVEERLVRVHFGLNGFYLQQPGLKDDKESYTYEAKFVPIGVERKPINLEKPDFTKLDKEAVKADRPENNYATTTVLARGEKRVLFIEPELGDHALLVKTLKSLPGSLKVGVMTPDQIMKQVPQDPERLGFFLGGFDCIILANVARDMISPEFDAAVRAAVHEQGVGLIMIGGQSGFGGGGWQDTEVEKALPVTCDLKSTEVEGRSGLVLVMHASEIAEGNRWQKEIAKLAIKKLSPIDMLGMLYYDGSTGNHRWHIPFQLVGPNKQRMLTLVDSMSPGDMPDAQPSLKKAYDALTDPKYKLGTKHVIFISDGDHWQPPVGLLQLYKAAKVTCTTVCITSHGQAEYQRMARVAHSTEGREYPAPDANGEYQALNPNQLPQIYMKETRLVSKAFFHDKPFTPDLLERAGPTEGLPARLPPLHGFVRTTPRVGPLIQIPIITPKIDGHSWPILAFWQYGLGKGVAFTSDAQTSPDRPPTWDVDWANSKDPAIYGVFWNQLVSWTLRELDQGKNLRISVERRDGKVFIVVNAHDDDFKPMADLDVIVRVTSPNPKAGDSSRADIKLEQKNAGRYEAEVRAEDVGSYFLTALATRNKRVMDKSGKLQTVKEGVGMLRASVTVPYSPEFAEMDANPALMQRLSAITGGKVFADDAETLASVARDGTVFRSSPAQSKSLQSIWHWLLVLTGIGLFFDVAIRRIAVNPDQASAYLSAYWQRLRGQAPPAEKSRQFLDRLKSRKEQVAEKIEQQKATRRFEGGDAPVAPPPVAGAEGTPSSPRPAAPPPKVAPDTQGQPEDYASRLLRAKRRAMEDRDKDNPTKGDS